MLMSSPKGATSTGYCADTVMWPSCTLPYAPPELALSALTDTYLRQNVVVRPSHDIWALGVVAYEALTQVSAQAARVVHNYVPRGQVGAGGVLDCT